MRYLVVLIVTALVYIIALFRPKKDDTGKYAHNYKEYKKVKRRKFIDVFGK